jgi:hypothetical protein
MPRKIVFIFGTMILCYSIGSFMVMFDLAQVPVINHDYARSHPEWRVQDFEYPVQTWELRIGDGQVSALENILIWLPLLFGFMRTVDLIRAFHDDEKENGFAYFMERVEA